LLIFAKLKIIHVQLPIENEDKNNKTSKCNQFLKEEVGGGSHHV
jgi:hypothetical protein